MNAIPDSLLTMAQAMPAPDLTSYIEKGVAVLLAGLLTWVLYYASQKDKAFLEALDKHTDRHTNALADLGKSITAMGSGLSEAVEKLRETIIITQATTRVALHLQARSGDSASAAEIEQVVRRAIAELKA